MGDPTDRLAELHLEREEERPSRPWMGRLLAAGALLALAALAAAWWWRGEEAVRVETARVVAVAGEDADVSVLDASGYVVARRRATVSSKVTGKIVEVSVEEGMEVAEGQLLARLDDATPRRLLALARAELERAETASGETAALLREAELDLERTRRLVADGVESPARLDAARAAAESLAARLEAERAQAEVARRQVDLRLQEIEDTRIRAPFAGVAISKDAQPGEMISPVSAGGGFTRTGVSTIVDMSSLEIEVDVNEAYIGRVEPGQRVVATLDAYPQWKIPAHVITVVPAADRQKATFKVRLGFEELGDPRILPEMGVKVAFQAEPAAAGEGGEAPSRRLLVPRRAVVSASGADVVWVVRGEEVERRAVAVGGTVGDRVEVTAGLRDGERVVVAPPEGLTDGAAVEVER